MKKLLTTLLLALSLSAYAQSTAPDYEEKIATYIYLDIDHDDRWGCIDTSKNAKPVTSITYGVSLECYSYDIDEFILNEHYRVAITDAVLDEIYTKITDAYYRSYKTEASRKAIRNSGMQMQIKNIITETLEEDEVSVCTNVYFTLLLQK